jgi:hypothetical protein
VKIQKLVFQSRILAIPRGPHIGKYLLPWGEISANVIWGKNRKRRREKGENVKEKIERGKEKGKLEVRG